MYKELLINKIEPYRKLGYKKLDTGVELFGHDTNIAPQAWLHKLFPALSPRDIIEMELLIGRPLPKSLTDFYLEMNGLKVFLTKLSLDGLRRSFSRNIEDAWQPFSIETPNVQERLFDANDSFVFFGFYDENSNSVYMDSSNEKVYMCKEGSSNPIKEWDNLYDFLKDELNRVFAENDPKYANKISFQ